jgi:hypothetical protein
VEGGVERSEDGGQTFENLRFGLPGSPFPQALASDPRAPRNLLADVSGWDATPSGTVFVHGVFRSTDRAAHWSRVAGLGLLRASTTATDFAFPPAGGSAVWLATDGQGIFRSLNGGASFRPAAIPGLPTPVVYDLEFDRRTPAALYAGTPGGLFRLASD